MKTKRDLNLTFLFLAALFVGRAGHMACEPLRNTSSELKQSPLFLELVKIGKLEHNSRMRNLLESNPAPFKGCVIYLEGY